MMKKFFASALALGAGLLINAIAQAEVTMPKVFGNHMVLQAEREGAPIWGKAAAGEKVSITLGDAKAEATASDDGKWSAKLNTPKAGGPFKLTIEGTNKIEFDDVLVGEVWVCSGQSNMEWSVSQSDNEPKAENEISSSIRLFKVQHNAAKDPQDDVVGSWVVCTLGTVPRFSAVGFFFARELTNGLKTSDGKPMPIGLISTNWGGTLAEAWTSKATLAADAENFGPILERSKEFKPGNPNQASVLYNGMIHPLLPYAIRGAIWYQGESNRSRAEQYIKLFPAMIGDWRKLWNQGDFPFYYVQLAPYTYNKAADSTELAELWEAQTKTLAVPNTGMAVTTDVGNLGDIHPRNKLDVGKRLALWALAKDYGKTDVVYSGPLYESQSIEDGKIRVKFKHTAGGLNTREDKPLELFTIAGEDKKFVKAEAKIDGETIVVSSPEVPKPIAVRYGWSEHAAPASYNLYNKAGLPASPFRTDDFPLMTAGRK